jgi:hypothetical protein
MFPDGWRDQQGEIMLTRFIPSLLLAAALLVGCKSSSQDGNQDAAAAVGSSDSAVYCDKCQTTFARVPVSGGSTHQQSGVIGYRTVAKHECKECRTVAVGVIQQGKAVSPGATVHKCSICGGSMTVCHTN